MSALTAMLSQAADGVPMDREPRLQVHGANLDLQDGFPSRVVIHDGDITVF